MQTRNMSRTLLQYTLGIIFLGSVVGIEYNEKGELRVVHKLVGGHLTINGNDDDVELITSSAGEGRDSKKKKPNEDEKKTLSQQVADGKYGLIQTEIFSEPVKQPGVISYKENSEVSKDNINNLGGLNKNDIWLAENHLLVIKGGTYPPHSERPHAQDTSVWPPIDDYRAPQRQVKIPKHPKVPPPFPVQLTENGPLLLLGTNASTTLNRTFGSQLYPLYPTENFVPEDVPVDFPYPHATNTTSGETPFPVPPYPPPGLGHYNSTLNGISNPVNGGFPPLFPFLGVTPPPPENITDQYDEDDPSIYYPPPYSFYYQKDNSTKVNAGPLVPGIVLPPPPDFFASLDDNSTETITKPTVTSTTTKTKYVYAITTEPSVSSKEKSHTTFTKINTILDDKKFPSVKNITIPTQAPNSRKPSVTQNVLRKKHPTVTVLKPITTSSPSRNQNNVQIPFKTYGPPTSRGRTVISTTQVPLKAYYTTTYKLDSILITQKPNRTYLPSGISTVNLPQTSSKPPTQFYYYEDNGAPKLQTFPEQPQRNYNIPKEYYAPVKHVDQSVKQPTPNREQNFQYYYINEDNLYNNLQPRQLIQTTKKPDTFSIHIARLKNQIHTHQTIQHNKNYYVNQNPARSPKPVYQYSFQAANYPTQLKVPLESEYYVQSNLKPPIRHYQVEIQEAIEVTVPPLTHKNAPENFYYQETVTENPIKYHKNFEDSNLQINKVKTPVIPKPISQYSFEVTPNPIYQQYYTKQDEKYFDEVTKQHFTVFGKKLPAPTTPLPHTRPPTVPNFVQQKPASLERDTLINYLPHQTAINPNAEYKPFIEDDRKYNVEYRPIQSIPSQIYSNYENRKLQQSIETFSYPENEDRSPYITYKLPGDDGTHFYFITPQLAQKREQNSSFYFSRSNTAGQRKSDKSIFT